MRRLLLALLLTGCAHRVPENYVRCEVAAPVLCPSTMFLVKTGRMMGTLTMWECCDPDAGWSHCVSY